LSRIDAWDWSRWLFSWILEVYEKDGVRKTDERIGIAVLRFSMNRFWRIWKMMDYWVFYIFGDKNTLPAPLKRGVRRARNKCWFNFKTIDVSSLNFNCQNTNSSQSNQWIPLETLQFNDSRNKYTYRF
jgi:hypothetical protein